MRVRFSKTRVGFCIVAALSVAAIVACSHNEIGKLDVAMRGDTVSFSGSSINVTADQTVKYLVLDLEVRRRNCDNDCTMWMIARQNIDEEFRATTATNQVGPIDYGSKSPGMDTRTGAKPLRAGTYSVTATIQIIGESGTLKDSELLHADFRLQSVASGLVLE